MRSSPSEIQCTAGLRTCDDCRWSATPAGRLKSDETQQQLTLFMGGRPEHRLIDVVVERSDGNPYLSELLIQGLPVSTMELPADLPADSPVRCSRPGTVLGVGA